MRTFTKATGASEVPNAICAEFIFHDARAHRFGVTKEQLVSTARKLVNSGLIYGSYRHVHVCPQGKSEVVIHVVYVATDEELTKVGKGNLKRKIQNFFHTEHPFAFKNINVCYGAYLVHLSN